MLVLTVCTGHGPWNNTLLERALQETLMSGCNRDRLDAGEKSQLTLVFNKVISLGKTREGFDEKVRSNSMYGPLLRTDEEVDKVFRAYASCSTSSPHHISKNKASGKNRTRKGQPLAAVALRPPVPESSADEKDPQPQDTSMSFPFLCQDGVMQFVESHWSVSEDHNTCHAEGSSGPHPLDLPVPVMRCVECGFENPMGFKCTACSSMKTHVPSLCSAAESSASRAGLQDPLMVDRLSVLDPPPETTITFRGEDCLITAWLERHSQACHLVFGKQEGPLDDHNQDVQLQ